MGKTGREAGWKADMGRAGRSSEEEGRRLSNTEDQSKAIPSPLDSCWISRQETGTEESS